MPHNAPVSLLFLILCVFSVQSLFAALDHWKRLLGDLMDQSFWATAQAFGYNVVLTVGGGLVTVAALIVGCTIFTS